MPNNNPNGRKPFFPEGKMEQYSIGLLRKDIDRIKKRGGQTFLRELILDELDYMDEEEDRSK